MTSVDERRELQQLAEQAGWRRNDLGRTDLYLRGELGDDPVAAANSPEGQELTRQSVDSWVAVIRASGTATAEELAAAKEVSLAQFAPDLAGASDDGDAGVSGTRG